METLRVEVRLIGRIAALHYEKKEGTTTAGEFNKKRGTAIYPVFTLIFDVFMIKL